MTKSEPIATSPCQSLRHTVTSTIPAILSFTPGTHTGDQLLVARVLDGDAAAARELYDAHATRVFGLAFRICGDRERARDLVQDAFVRVFAQLHGFRGDAALSSWIHRVTLSVVLNAKRRDRRFEKELDIDTIAPLADARTPAADPDLREQLRDAIDALPDIYRYTFVMHDIEGFGHAEIANAMNVAVGTSKSRLSQARAMLRARLAPFMSE